MAARDSTQSSFPNPHAAKRKFDNDSHDPSPKKRRAADAQLPNRTPNRTHNPAQTTSNYGQIHNPLLAKLSGKFEIKTMSVLPSTSIRKHVDRALGHLGRFSIWDKSVLPGVVLLCAKSSASTKLITIAEIIRRRIGESEQKWFQYNVPKETVIEEPPPSEDPSVVEDTYMDVDKEGGDDTDGEYFETRQPTIHEQAVQPAKVRYEAHVVILLSRLPLDELAAEPNVSSQTNERSIEHLRKKKMGLLG
ncbi:hypothetical protein CHGG_08668 [Chaetomium globosum CBS 148.51]|uniref:DNA/RNA-binding protein Alba-like domain-containing protein n=1 Tax=Chaetomium globosum (strain ATCC 6205 / CBS 148.51 / DSM 1962 / NBRC 6347 / NRRL 1970) TaxID=306901 RepID=Q2GTN6_CHAGB|nr:uncharacterized protein CHGG_08668 [Chaetomium globosum CBS 148.51]EAQ84654.1 hypothetical protein CHGG_08668 [Chaetomium globosum CBS 148.51]